MPIARFQMPDGRIGRFEVPEGVTPEQATALISQQISPQQPAQPNIGEDIAKSVAYRGVPEGLAASTLPGFSLNVVRGVSDATRWAGHKIYEGITGEDLPYAGENPIPTSSDVLQGASKVLTGQRLYEPKTVPGQYANTVAQFAAGGKASRIPLRTTIPAAVASETAGQLTEGSEYEGAARLAGAVLTPAAIAAGSSAVKSGVTGAKNLTAGAAARTAEELDSAANTMRESSNQAYKAMRDAGAVINKNRAINITNRVETAINTAGKTNKNLHANTLSVLDDFKQAARQGDFTLEELDQFRQLFRGVINKGNKIDPDGFMAGKAIDAIDDAVDNLKKIDLRGGNTEAVDALNLGRSEWAKARSFETVADIVKRSDGDANYVKREIKKLVNNPKKMRGFTADERTALKEASKLSAGEGLFKMMGKFGIDFGNSRVGNAGLPAVVTIMQGGDPSIAAIGTVARHGQKLLARGKVENALKTIENRPASPVFLPQQPAQNFLQQAFPLQNMPTSILAAQLANLTP